MAVKQKSSPVGLILLLVFFFLAGVIIAFTSGAAQKKQQTRSKADVAPLTLSFSTGTVQNGVTPVILSATSSVGVGFGDVTLTFDKTKVQVAGDVIGGTALPLVVRVSPTPELPTSVANANATGKIQIPMALPTNNMANPPTGTFELFRVPFKLVSGVTSGVISIDVTPTNFIDLGSNNIPFNNLSFTLGSASVSPTTSTGVVCWNYAVKTGTQYYWPNGCKGTPNQDICTMVVINLTQSEITQYEAWVAAGSPTYQGCGSVTATKAPGTCSARCNNDADCGSGYCYHPPMPTCPAGVACPEVMPLPICRNNSCPTSSTCSCNNPTATTQPTSTTRPTAVPTTGPYANPTNTPVIVDTCTLKAPEISLTPSKQVGFGLQSLTYTYHIKNVNMGECASQTWNVESFPPDYPPSVGTSKWKTVDEASTVTLATGEQKTVKVTVEPQEAINDGDYEFSMMTYGSGLSNPAKLTAVYTEMTSIIPNPPSWWYLIPTPLRNFLEQLYAWVYLFRQPTTQQNLLEGLPTPTP